MILKRIFIISTILLLITLVFFGIYTVAFKTEDAQIIKNNIKKTGEESKKNNVDITDKLAAKLVNITSEPIVSATIVGEDIIYYYDAIDGRAWSITTRGTNQKALSGNDRGVPAFAKWSPDGKSVILTYEDGNIFTYNHDTGTEYKLRDGMDDVVWSGVSNKILYKYFNKDTKERTLNVANYDGTNWKKIADLPFRFTTFTQIPSSILAAFWPTADININTELFTVSTITTGTPKKIFSDKLGADFLFSPDGDKVLVSSVSDGGKKLVLGIMDSNGKNYIDLNVPTIVNKVTWSEDGENVYYAQPNNIPDDAVWPNDYNDKKFHTTDTFFKININTGKKTRLVDLDEITEQIDAVDLFLSPSEDMLFFTNRIDGLLYRIKL